MISLLLHMLLQIVPHSAGDRIGEPQSVRPSEGRLHQGNRRPDDAMELEQELGKGLGDARVIDQPPAGRRVRRAHEPDLRAEPIARGAQGRRAPLPLL